MKIVLAADGSEHTRVAARKVAGMLAWFKERPEVHVLHVRPPFPSSAPVFRPQQRAVANRPQRSRF